MTRLVSSAHARLNCLSPMAKSLSVIALAGCSRFPRGDTPSYSVRMTVEVGPNTQQKHNGEEGQNLAPAKTVTIGEFCWTGT
eukprot:COSAG02_NODE_4321_length_5506_cov_63.368599_5_plen_82_part_00